MAEKAALKRGFFVTDGAAYERSGLKPKL